MVTDWLNFMILRISNCLTKIFFIWFNPWLPPGFRTAKSIGDHFEIMAHTLRCNCKKNRSSGSSSWTKNRFLSHEIFGWTSAKIFGCQNYWCEFWIFAPKNSDILFNGFWILLRENSNISYIFDNYTHLNFKFLAQKLKLNLIFLALKFKLYFIFWREKSNELFNPKAQKVDFLGKKSSFFTVCRLEGFFSLLKTWKTL